MPSRPPTLRQPWHKPRQQAERERKRSLDRSRHDDPARRLYKTARWQKLRARQLAEHPLCQCPACDEGRKRVNPATVVDHVKPHRGDEELFYDPANLMSMSKRCHDRKTATQDSGFARR